jgi:hypothetical protein
MHGPSVAEVILLVVMCWLLPVAGLTLLFFRLLMNDALRPSSTVGALFPLRGKWLQRLFAGFAAFFLALMIVPVGYLGNTKEGTRPCFLWEAFLPQR